MGSDGDNLYQKPDVTISNPEGDPVSTRNDEGDVDSATDALEDNPAARLMVPPDFDRDQLAASLESASRTVINRLPDVNVYQQKKTLAQGMMDLALLSANATQLRLVMESKKTHPYYYASVFFIIASIFFQLAVGIGLVLNCRYNIKKQKHICPANKVNNVTVMGVYIITVINVFVSAFSVFEAPPPVIRQDLQDNTTLIDRRIW